ncbi:CDP-glucose 4,6-dehydratase [Clostridium hydrogenum]|uniref:CDP-glucose 4,6-dehydratase n=1 Tax=Clostridium hydrogenum TaxID=2855764 RepID=UPI001F258F8C|nr:CDP-glucose 4,6-dehydratase [Clostridium hydrogenum]
MDLKDIFLKKNVLITGHTGFKGSWLSIWLKDLGANVIGYSLDPYTAYDNFNLCELNSKVIDIRGDIRDSQRLEEVFNTYKPEFVFHLAAQPLVRKSYENPKETYEANVIGTLNVLEAIRKCKTVKVGIMVTTDKCYENKEQHIGYKETDPMGGYDPYSSSKGCAELLIASYRNSFFNVKDYSKHGKAIASVRAGNVIGGGDFAEDRIVPDCIKAIEKGDIINIRSPHAVRPWQFVLEPLSGYILLAAKMYNEPLKYSGAWNFGPNETLNMEVQDVVNEIIKSYGKGHWEDISELEKLHEANLLMLDCSKAREALNWQQALNFEETINMTVSWYKNYKDKDMYEFCKAQIEEYAKKQKVFIYS